MKLRKMLFLIYLGAFFFVIMIAKYFVQLMLFDQKTANVVMFVALITTIILTCVNYIVITPIIKIILDLQKISQKNAKGEFRILDRKSYVSEFSVLLNDYNQMVHQLEQQVALIKQSEKEKIEMISNLSHDIKTPVSSLIAVGQALLDDILDEAEKKYYLHAVFDNCHRISDLSDELLQIIDSDNLMLETAKEELWLDSILIRVLNGFKGKIAYLQKEIFVESVELTKAIYSDESAIFRVLYNIIDNSLKYSRSGTPIHIKIEEQSNVVRIEIKDYGQGIPKVEQEKIFRRTYRIEKSRSQETGGYGLGLSITKKLLENLGGTISVSSKEGEGSTFYIEFPY